MQFVKPKHSKKLCCDQQQHLPETEARTIKETTTGYSNSLSVANFLSELEKINLSAGILSIVLEHSDKFVPKSCGSELPTCLSSLYQSKFFDLPYHELLTECIKVYDKLTVTIDQASKLEKMTRKQSNSKCGFVTELEGLQHQGLKLLYLQT